MPKPRLSLVGTVEGSAEEGFTVPGILDDELLSEVIRLPVKTASGRPYDPRATEPVLMEPPPTFPGDQKMEYWLFRGRIVRAENAGSAPRAELTLEITDKVLRDEKRLARIRRELEALDNLERLPAARREHIPDSVRLFVWQRDEGRCVTCGSQARLEFDHIIPVEKGGSSTARNIQLLCEACNRTKGANL